MCNRIERHVQCRSCFLRINKMSSIYHCIVRGIFLFENVFYNNLIFVFAVFSGACGPCPVEALRRGDVGQRDDVDAFYASLNAYVRYFYEDDESGWGYSPFRQFR